MDDEQKTMYLDVLKEGVTPFDRFVSRSDMKDIIDVPEPRKLVDSTIIKLLKIIANDHTTRFLPIIGAAGTGKTHLYWVLKDHEEDLGFYTVYIPSPPAPVRMLFHIYSCLMDELGNILLKRVGSSLVKQYGGSSRSLDPFGLVKFKRSARELQRLARRDFSGLQSEFVRALIIYHMKALNWKLAERWLVGEALTESDLNRLSLSRVIEEDDISIAALKVITKYSDRPIILYFDELEIPYRSFGEEAEIRLLSIQKRLYNEINNSLIIVACLEEIWPRVTELTDSAMRSRMEMELRLRPFSLQNTRNLYLRAMEKFWDENNIPSPSDSYFPLNERVFDLVFEKTRGNPRETIKMIKVFIDQTLYDVEIFQDLQEKMELIEQTRTQTEPISPSPTEDLSSETQTDEWISEPLSLHDMGEKIISDLDKIIEDAVKKKEDEFQAELAEQIEVTPAITVSAAIDSILTLTKTRNIEVKVQFDYEFTIKGKQKKISAFFLDLEGNKIGLDIPTIKTFDKSGGVAAYYAINRLKEAISAGAIDHACLIVPRRTGGKKYSMICEDLGAKLSLIELNQEEAQELIRKAKTEPSQKGREFARLVLKDLPLDLSVEESNEEMVE
ncbi:MAG: hypothetical protein ACTSRC_09335 [Candidatus Helarchaeota archaeon]